MPSIRHSDYILWTLLFAETGESHSQHPEGGPQQRVRETKRPRDRADTLSFQKKRSPPPEQGKTGGRRAMEVTRRVPDFSTLGSGKWKEDTGTNPQHTAENLKGRWETQDTLSLNASWFETGVSPIPEYICGLLVRVK